MDASERIKALAAEHGFPLCGLAAVPADGRAPGAEHFEEWLARGFHGPLAYLHESASARVSVKGHLPWAKSVLCVGAHYGLRIGQGQAQGATEAAPAMLRDHVARYAWGRDYHRVFGRRLKALAKSLIAEGLCAQARGYADTGPVLERAWAAAAGLGWIGKNTCLIHPRGGSYWSLGELVLDAEVQPDAPLKDHCGTCRRCLAACPTGALVEPRVMDARRCLATGNLELKNETPGAFWAGQHGWAAGCDACQEACPFNAPGRTGEPDAEPAAPPAWHAMTLAEAIVLTRERYDRDFRASALRRTGFRGLRLGAITAAAGMKDPAVRAALEACLSDADEGIRTRAAWALKQ